MAFRPYASRVRAFRFEPRHDASLRSIRPAPSGFSLSLNTPEAQRHKRVPELARNLAKRDAVLF